MIWNAVAAVAALMLSGAIFIIGFLALCDAPIGYEDERGFHYGEPDDDGR